MINPSQNPLLVSVHLNLKIMSSLPTKSLHESSREKAYSIESSTASTSDLSSSSEIARSKIADNSEIGNSQLFVDNELQRCKMELQSRRSQKGNWHPSVAETLNKLGLFHLHMRNDLDVAEYYFNDALRILRQCKDLSMDNEIATTLSDIGNIYERRNNNVLALENYR